MRRRLRRGSPTGDEVPVGSFADIAFLLIIFFVIVMSIEPPAAGLEMEAPAGEKSEAKQEKDTTIQINDGAVYLNEKRIKQSQLPARLARLKLRDKPPAEKVVMLETTGTVQWEQFLQVTAWIEQAGGLPVMSYEED
jgi:biopolymer transport protein ExbD